MKHIVKTVSRFLLLGAVACCGFFALQSNSQSYTPAFADEGATATKQYSEADFADEEQASSGELAVSLIESTTTSTSQSLNFSFKTITLEGWKTSRANYIVSITDPNYTGNQNEPVPEDFDGEYAEVENSSGEIETLPVLEGAVSFVLGSNTNTNKQVRLPSTLTRESSFIIKVKTITSHCVTADGAEYNGKNTWYNDNNELKITSIYIPDTIETVEPHAFTGVPAEGVTINYEGASIPEGFADDWTDAASIEFNKSIGSSFKYANVGGKVDDMSKPANFILGCKSTEDFVNNQVEKEIKAAKEAAEEAAKEAGEEIDYVPPSDEEIKAMQQKYRVGCDRPLAIQYDKIKANGSRETIYETLPLLSARGNYDSVGDISSKSNSRTLSYKLGPGESIDDDSIVLHNLMKSSDDALIDTSATYWVKPHIKYHEKLDLSKLLTFKAAGNSTFAGFSIFSLTMDKNLTITSEKYPEPHSLYLDVKSDIYEQNKLQIEKGTTVIRYSLNNLYLSSYRFVYEGKGGQLKEAIVGIDSVITYQILESDKNNKVSILVENKKVAPDFSAEKVRTFELTNVTVQMDLFTTSNTGSTSVLGKSAITYKFGYITVRNDEKLNVFNWNIFLIIFFLAFVALYAIGAFVLYKVLKEKFKNDEFRRINDKKYLKKAILFGLGFTEIALAIVFILMRAVGFANTIVAFNPTDPLLIVFAIAGLIIGGYFIVILVKSIKANNERKKAIRLKLNEDVNDDGTN